MVGKIKGTAILCPYNTKPASEAGWIFDPLLSYTKTQLASQEG